MDKTDLAIIDKLTEDARMSFRKIAKELGIAPDTVIKRYAALQEKGVIRGSTVVLNPRKLGYEAMAVFTIDVSPAHTPAKKVISTNSSTILEKLIKMRNIILATKTVGISGHDLLAICVAIDFKHLVNLKNDIAKIPGVKDLQVSFWVEKAELCSKYFVV
jgi:Lrp/AsnC family transcriptional regulator for asnA, asnC and gidA